MSAAAIGSLDDDDSEDDDSDDEDDDGGNGGGRVMAESAGADDEGDENVVEDYAPAARRDEEQGAEAQPEAHPAPEAQAEMPVADEAGSAAIEPAADAPAAEEAAEAPQPEARSAAEEAATPGAGSAEAAMPVADEAGSAAVPAEAPAAAEASEPASEPAATEATEVGAPASEAPSPDAESGEDDERDVASDDDSNDEGGKSRRRSRRGGRSRRSRRGKRSDDKPEARSDDEPKEAPSGAPVVEPAEAREEAGEEMSDAISARRIFQRRYKIQEVIKVRQILLVQVVKEERGNKGAALTTYLSLAGRYCVLMPNTARGGGISRKITNAADRKKLKEIASGFEVPKGMGLIVRTAGAKRSAQEINRDYEYLLRQWEQIREITLKSIAPTLIYEEGSLIKRVIRDLYSNEIDQICVEGEEGYREAKDYMGMLMPTHARNVVRHDEPVPLFAKHGVEQELASLIHPVVQLKSGGYIVIGVTEALVAIDINSGKSTKEGSIEDTALKTNLEASDEIARQLKLRDLAGLIVIDFIDMEDPRNNRSVEKRMKERLKDDRARIQLGRISAFGLMEMSRQRLRPGVLEATTAPCAHCHGTGIVRADSSLSLTILRQLEGEAAKNRAPELLVRAPMGAALYLLNDKRDNLSAIEARYDVVIRVQADPALVSPEFHVERVKTPTRKPAQLPAVTALSVMPPDLEEEPVEEAEVIEAEAPAPAQSEPEPSADDRAAADDEGSRRRRGRRGGRRRRRGGEDEGQEDSRPSSDAEASESKSEAAPAPEVEADASIPAPKRTRRRRKPKREEEDAESSSPADAEAHAATSPEAAEAPSPAPTEAQAEVAAEAPAAADEAPEAPAADPAPAAAPEAELAPEHETSVTPGPDSAEAPDAEAAAEAPAPATEPQAAEEPPTEAKPRRRGWWSLKR